LKFENKEDLF